MTTTSNPEVFTYQMRSGLGGDPFEVLTRLTHQVWTSLATVEGMGPLDPHLWPEIFQILRLVFKNRLTFHPLCGQRQSCLDVPCVLCGEGAHTHPPYQRIHILQTRRPLPKFLATVASALARRIAHEGLTSNAVRGEIEKSIVQILKDHFFVSESCRNCPVRTFGPGDRREWPRDVLGYSWGGLRRIQPEDHPLVDEVEEA